MNREALRELAQEMERFKPVLVICGGGHVGYYIAKMGHMLDFEVVVIDDRESFANTERFPNATVICKPFVEAIREIEHPEACYFTIVARGHAHDTDCLKAVLDRDFAYVGMMGSKVKIKVVMEHMKEVGYDEALLKQVHTPIGLPCSAITPAEIAVSVAAELVQVKNTLSSEGYVGNDVTQAMLRDEVAVLARIVEKKGSAPRGIGSTLVLKKDGTVIGTVGGGNVENLVIERAKELVGTDTTEYMDCNMISKAKGNINMVCGGIVKVLIETIVE